MPIERCPACGSKELYRKCYGCGATWNDGKIESLSDTPCTPDNTHVGAVVRLNGGGPEMTVADIDDADVRCAINTEHYWDTGRFPLACLTLVRPATTTAPAEVKP